MIGKSDPELAKVKINYILNKKENEKQKEDPNCLRAKFGKTLIKNELHGSDNAIDSNKERDIF